MTTKENIATLLRQLQSVIDAPTASGAPVEVAQSLATLSLLLLRDHPERTAIQSLVTSLVIVALDAAETHASSMN